MRHARGPDFSFSRLKIHVFGNKLDTLCATRAEPNLAFRALNPCLMSKIGHFRCHSRGPDFSVSHLKIHVLGHKLDTLCATRADPNLAFRALKSVFKVNN